eukprot:c5310_g1_i1.p1 GENE.c5310_g1_i1~~c5310_g1_i1.p1  ORF type:complete len:233 (+),score=32.83 c5310_g1_i1:32-730(+)
MLTTQLDGPLTTEDVLEAKAAIFNQDFSASEGWELVMDLKLKDGEECIVHKRPVPATGLSLFRAVTRVNVECEKYYECYKDNEYRKTWDSSVVDISFLAEDAGNKIWHWIVKFPWPMSNRDYVYYQRTEAFPEERVFVISGRSVNRDLQSSYKPEQSGVVRVEQFVSTVAIRSLGPGKCEVLCFYFDDPKGSIPKVVVNYATKQAFPSILSNFSAALNKYDDYLKKQQSEKK